MIDPDFSPLSVHRHIDRPEMLALAAWRREGLRASMLTIIAIDGKSPRTVGAQMAVNERGQIQGYLTGGCLEHELAAVALHLMSEGKNEVRRYGRGSPYIDLKLPCGSGIDIYYDHALPDSVVFEAESLLLDRKPFTVTTDIGAGTSILARVDAADLHRPQQQVREGLFERLYKPALRLRVFGAGFSAVQLAFLAGSAGLRVEFSTNDRVTVSAAAAMGIKAEPMQPADHTVGPGDDWTASMLMFHEHEHELSILAQLVGQPGFYIGAIGNRLVNEQRAEALRQRGFGEAEIARVTMPAGLVRQARSATEIAVGVLAEILDAARAGGLVI